MSEIKKVVLAYSGGLDTSIILKWLEDVYDCEVVTFTADIGQGEFMRKSLTKNSTTTDTNRVIFSSRNHIKTTQEIVLFPPVFCPTIGGRFTDSGNNRRRLIYEKTNANYNRPRFFKQRDHPKDGEAWCVPI